MPIEIDNLAYRAASNFVHSYAHEAHEKDDVVERHEQAIDCRKCEDFLQLGIDAFNWIIRADLAVRQAMFEGSTDFDHDMVEDGIRALCKLWLEPCKHAEKWVSVQDARSLKVNNLDAFRACCAEMRAIVAAQGAHDQGAGDQEIPAAIAELREQAIEEHRNGQTAEFLAADF